MSRQAPDFRRAGQEHQQAAGFLDQRAADGRHQPPFERPVARQVAHAHRKTAPGAADARRAAQQVGHGGAVQRGAHHQQPQVRPQQRLRLQAQREAQIGLQAALVVLVEDDQPDAAERRVGLQQARQDALGDDLDARGRRHPTVQARAVADGLAFRLADEACHAPCRGARSEPARLEQQDFLIPEPRRCQQIERHARGLAGARRRLQHHRRVVLQRRAQRRQGFVDGQFGTGHPAMLTIACAAIDRTVALAHIPERSIRIDRHPTCTKRLETRSWITCVITSTACCRWRPSPAFCWATSGYGWASPRCRCC
ncbi:MAG: hypothetical protein OZX49_02646 [Immundisolibacter sp.]|nr:hypothetical protein [Immundisolibacter sp.]